MSSPEEYMLPCLSKKILGIDCLGCGMQRSAVSLAKGDFSAAFQMYPAIFTLIILFVFLMFHLKFKFKNGHNIILILFIVNIFIILTNYIIKHFLN
ncbi:MAG: DUF2752 domain-containing protein [Aquaticitalea sp.]